MNGRNNWNLVGSEGQGRLITYSLFNIPVAAIDSVLILVHDPRSIAFCGTLPVEKQRSLPDLSNKKVFEEKSVGSCSILCLMIFLVFINPAIRVSL